MSSVIGEMQIKTTRCNFTPNGVARTKKAGNNKGDTDVSKSKLSYIDVGL